MGKRILLADDSITIQKVVELTFSDTDFDVISVGNGDQALRKAREILPDIVLLDVIMPEKNGYEVCQILKQDPDLRHIPVLLLTGTFESFDDDRAASAGADGYITKPFEQQALISKVEELLSSTPRLSKTNLVSREEPGTVLREKQEIRPVTSSPDRHIFICHAEVDKAVANILRDYLRQADKKVTVFVASHPDSLPGGHEWWEEIRDNLRNAKVVLTLVSNRSKDRPWLHFESGGAFFRDTLVIPLALPPMPKSFPLPLGVLQGFDLGAVGDVRALVKQLAATLSVTFARPAEDLARELEEPLRQISPASPRASAVEIHATAWEEELRKLAARGGTVRICPVVPAIFAAKEFAIQEIEAAKIGLRKLDSGHHIYVPPYRVVGIRRDASGYVLDIQGRVQWVDADSSWHYMPDELQVNDPHGLPREVTFKTEEVMLLIGKLRADGWQAAFVHEPNAKAKIGRNYQLVYGSDGRYLKVPDRPYAQLMVKYREGAGP